MSWSFHLLSLLAFGFLAWRYLLLLRKWQFLRQLVQAGAAISTGNSKAATASKYVNWPSRFLTAYCESMGVEFIDSRSLELRRSERPQLIQREVFAAAVLQLRLSAVKLEDTLNQQTLVRMELVNKGANSLTVTLKQGDFVHSLGKDVIIEVKEVF